MKTDTQFVHFVQAGTHDISCNGLGTRSPEQTQASFQGCEEQVKPDVNWMIL